MANTDFRAQSYNVWQRMAAGWDRDRQWIWEGSRGVGEWMVEALDPQPGQTILELAAGTGETGFLAAARVGDDGKLISTDFEEVAHVSHRALVFKDGMIVREIAREELTVESLVAHASGAAA